MVQFGVEKNAPPKRITTFNSYIKLHWWKRAAFYFCFSKKREECFLFGVPAYVVIMQKDSKNVLIQTWFWWRLFGVLELRLPWKLPEGGLCVLPCRCEMFVRCVFTSQASWGCHRKLLIMWRWLKDQQMEIHYQLFRKLCFDIRPNVLQNF